MLFIVLLLTFAFVVLTVYAVIPFFFQTAIEINKKRARDFARDMDRTMLQEDIHRVTTLYVIGPFVAGAIGLFVFQVLGLVAGAFLGFIVPKIYGNFLVNQRKKQFGEQLVDALMIMSSSFRGGLSLIQSMEAVVEEMSDPIRQEFAVVLGENKMGVSLDEAMGRLYKRMPSPALQQMISAILLARETGGNLPAIFTRIVSTIRERRKIEENLKVLTLQGRLQAFVMSGLPIGFFFLVNATNKNYFKIMITTDIGRMLLLICLVLWLLGTFFILQISAFKDF